jgi:hypothetical protein
VSRSRKEEDWSNCNSRASTMSFRRAASMASRPSYCSGLRQKAKKYRTALTNSAADFVRAPERFSFPRLFYKRECQEKYFPAELKPGENSSLHSAPHPRALPGGL